jgi:hypothetical protein
MIREELLTRIFPNSNIDCNDILHMSSNSFLILFYFLFFFFQVMSIALLLLSRWPERQLQLEDLSIERAFRCDVPATQSESSLVASKPSETGENASSEGNHDGTDNSAALEGGCAKAVKVGQFFAEGVSKDDQDVIAQKVLANKLMIAQLEKKRKEQVIKRLVTLHRNITVEEARHAVRETKDDEDEAAQKLADPDFLYAIRRCIALEHNPAVKHSVRYAAESTLNAAEVAMRKQERRAQRANRITLPRRERTKGRLMLDDALRVLAENEAKTGTDAVEPEAYQNKFAQSLFSFLFQLFFTLFIPPSL